MVHDVDITGPGQYECSSCRENKLSPDPNLSQLIEWVLSDVQNNTKVGYLLSMEPAGVIASFLSSESVEVRLDLVKRKRNLETESDLLRRDNNLMSKDKFLMENKLVARNTEIDQVPILFYSAVLTFKFQLRKQVTTFTTENTKIKKVV